MGFLGEIYGRNSHGQEEWAALSLVELRSFRSCWRRASGLVEKETTWQAHRSFVVGPATHRVGQSLDGLLFFCPCASLLATARLPLAATLFLLRAASSSAGARAAPAALPYHEGHAFEV